MKQILAGFLVAGLASCFAPPSNAAPASWSHLQYWEVMGDQDGPYCVASSSYTGGRTLYIALNVAGWNFSISGISVTPGDEYTVGVATKFSSGQLVGMATSADQVVFNQINRSTLANLMAAPKLAIQDLGVFPLKGSQQAIGEVYKCFQALTGRDA